MRKICLLLALLCIVGTSAVAVADDFHPATFRGDPLSVEAHWEFTQAPMDYYNISPDEFYSVGGSNGETLYGGFSTYLKTDTIDWRWVGDPADQLDGGITPILVNGGIITLELQNWIDNMPRKYIRVQITSWWANGLSGQPDLLPMAVFSDPFKSWALLDSGYIPVGQGVDSTKDYSWFDIMIIPNPDWETIGFTVPEGLVIDEIDIDTVSVPEPITVSLVGFGALLAMRKRS